MVSFTLRPLYSLDRRLGEPQSRSGGGGEEKTPCPCRESNPGRPARSLVIILTKLTRLRAFAYGNHKLWPQIQPNCKFVPQKILLKCLLVDKTVVIAYDQQFQDELSNLINRPSIQRKWIGGVEMREADEREQSQIQFLAQDGKNLPNLKYDETAFSSHFTWRRNVCSDWLLASQAFCSLELVG
jgi:hypothetical protein